MYTTWGKTDFANQRRCWQCVAHRWFSLQFDIDYCCLGLYAFLISLSKEYNTPETSISLWQIKEVTCTHHSQPRHTTWGLWNVLICITVWLCRKWREHSEFISIFYVLILVKQKSSTNWIKNVLTFEPILLSFLKEIVCTNFLVFLIGPWTRIKFSAM